MLSTSGTRRRWLVTCAAAVAVGWSAHAGPAGKVITLSESVGVSRPARGEARALHAVRSALVTCGEDAVTPLVGVVAYRLFVDHTGRVSRVSLSSPDAQSPGDDELRACIERALKRVAIDPPGGGGQVLSGTLVWGEPSASKAPMRAFDPASAVEHDLPPLWLATARTRPEGSAVAALVNATRHCGSATATTVHGSMSVAPDGRVFEASVQAEPSDAALVGCITRHIDAGGRPAVVVRVNVDLAIDKGLVRVVR